MTGPRFLDEEENNTDAIGSDVAGAATPNEALELPRGPMFLEGAADVPPRLRMDWQPDVIATKRPTHTTTIWILLGIAVILASWAAFSLIAFVVGLLRVSEDVGILAAIAIGTGCALSGYGLVGEYRAYRSLLSTDRLRATLADSTLPLIAVRVAGMAWANRVAAGASVDLGALEQSLRAAETAAELRALLRSRVDSKLRDEALVLGRQAAVQAAAAVAVCPHPALDGLLVGLRSFVMVRQIAMLFGVKPGMAATVGLLRRIGMTAATVGTVDLISQSVGAELLNKLPLVRHVAASIPGASTAALRIYRLAGVVAEACSPLGKS